MLLQMALFHSFLWLSNIPLYIYTTFLYPFLCRCTFRWLPWPYMAIVNSAAMNIRVHVSFQIRVFSGYMPRSGIAKKKIKNRVTKAQNLNRLTLQSIKSNIYKFKVISWLFHCPLPQNSIFRGKLQNQNIMS